MLASERGHASVVDVLIKYNVQVDWKSKVSTKLARLHLKDATIELIYGRKDIQH